MTLQVRTNQRNIFHKKIGSYSLLGAGQLQWIKIQFKDIFIHNMPTSTCNLAFLQYELLLQAPTFFPVSTWLEFNSLM